jgi:hypothetical protein
MNRGLFAWSWYMKLRNLILTLFGVLGLGGGLSGSYVAEAATTSSSQSEALACQAALKANTIVALEDFLRKYPLGVRPSACGALAFNALSNFTGGTPGNVSGNSGGHGYGG